MAGIERRILRQDYPQSSDTNERESGKRARTQALAGSDSTFLPFHIQSADNLFTGNREQFESLIHYLLGNDV